jgi:hypothetical protein
MYNARTDAVPVRVRLRLGSVRLTLGYGKNLGWLIIRLVDQWCYMRRSDVA